MSLELFGIKIYSSAKAVKVANPTARSGPSILKVFANQRLRTVLGIIGWLRYAIDYVEVVLWCNRDWYIVCFESVRKVIIYVNIYLFLIYIIMKSDNDKFSTVSLCHGYIKSNLYASFKEKTKLL